MAIEGIQLLTTPASEPNAGIFNLPPEFDRKTFVGHWARQGSEVESKQQREHLQGTRYTADGWTVWKYPEESKLKGKLCTVRTRKGEDYVLMFRKRSIQENVNAIYGNVSKKMIMAEYSGQTVAGQPRSDSGILTNEILNRHQIKDFGGDTSFNVQFNNENVNPAPDIVAETK